MREIPARLSKLGIQDASAVNAVPQKNQGASELETPSRAWRFRFGAHELWCVATEATQGSVLREILRSAGAYKPTAIERSIFGEWMCRLLQQQAIEDAPQEELRARPPMESWRCDVEFETSRAQRSQLYFFTAASPPRPVAFAATVQLAAVPIALSAIVPARDVRLREVLQWSAGARISLQRRPEQLAAGLILNGRQLAIGKIGSLFGERAIKLTTIAPACGTP